MKKENLITALKEIMEKEIEILFAYLHGSYAHNVIHFRIDIDFEAIVMNRFFELSLYLGEYNRTLLQRIKEDIISNSPKVCFKNNPCFWKERNSLFTVFTT